MLIYSLYDEYESMRPIRSMYEHGMITHAFHLVIKSKYDDFRGYIIIFLSLVNP